MRPYYDDGRGIVIYHADCRDVLPTLEADALITDPPYGVDFAGKVTKHTVNRPDGIYVDTEVNFHQVILPAVSTALLRTKRALLFVGTRRLHEYPVPADIGGIVCPNGAGRSAWGFGCFHPVLFYGTRPRAGAYPTVTVQYHPGMHVTGENNGHPCPKPIIFMRWAINMASLEGDAVLDPFMGSGTTLRAAKDLGRRAIGIEIEERYCEIAARRLQQEVLPLEVVG